MSGTECENLINLSLEENCDTGSKTTKNMLKFVNKCISVGKQFFPPLRRENKGNRFEESFLDFEEQQQAEVEDDPFEMMEKEAQLKARQLGKNSFEADVASKLSIHGMSLSSPSCVNNDLKVENTVKLFSSLQLNEPSLSAESPLKFVDDDIMSEEQANSRNAEKLFQADLETLKIPILGELNAVEKRKFIENEGGTIRERASAACNGLNSLNALKAKLKWKSKEIAKNFQTDGNRQSLGTKNRKVSDAMHADLRHPRKHENGRRFTEVVGRQATFVLESPAVQNFSKSSKQTNNLANFRDGYNPFLLLATNASRVTDSDQMPNDRAFDFVTALNANLHSEDPKQPKNTAVSPSHVWNKKRSDLRTSTRVSGLLPYSTNVNKPSDVIFLKPTNMSKVAANGRTKQIEKPLPEQAAIKPAYIPKNVISNSKSGLRQKSVFNEKSIRASMTSLKCTLPIKKIAETSRRSLRPEIAQASLQVKTRRSSQLIVKPTHNKLSIRAKDSSKLTRSPGKNASLKNSSSKELARSLRGDSTLSEHSSIRGPKSNSKHYPSKLPMDERMDEWMRPTSAGPVRPSTDAPLPSRGSMKTNDNIISKSINRMRSRSSTFETVYEVKVKQFLKPEKIRKNSNTVPITSAQALMGVSRLTASVVNKISRKSNNTLASKDVTSKTGSHIGPRTSTIRSTSEFKTKSSLKLKINGKDFNAAAAISAGSSKLTSRMSTGAPNNASTRSNNKTKPNTTAKPLKYRSSMFTTSSCRNKENNRP
uniref:Uncharacterized protein n=1 Tax=Glossina austeni TaxID=7395 RepID=A0A1A9UI45_GLOAU